MKGCAIERVAAMPPVRGRPALEISTAIRLQQSFVMFQKLDLPQSMHVIFPVWNGIDLTKTIATHVHVIQDLVTGKASRRPLTRVLQT